MACMTGAGTPEVFNGESFQSQLSCRASRFETSRHEAVAGNPYLSLAAIGRYRHRLPPIWRKSTPPQSVPTSEAAIPDPAERGLLPAAGAAPATELVLLQVKLPW